MKMFKIISVLLMTTLFSLAQISFANTSDMTTTKDSSTTMTTDTSSSQPLKDTGITAQIKAVYAKEKLFGDKDISVTGVSVETTNGVVVLTGTVDTQAQADNAVKLAKSIQGVKSVDSKLMVKPQ